MASNGLQTPADLKVFHLLLCISEDENKLEEHFMNSRLLVLCPEIATSCILGKGKRFSFSPKYSEPLWVPLTISCRRYRWLLPVGQTDELPS
jgi:hypothetical protein